jgi:hypothetical protein
MVSKFCKNTFTNICKHLRTFGNHVRKCTQMYVSPTDPAIAMLCDNSTNVRKCLSIRLYHYLGF